VAVAATKWRKGGARFTGKRLLQTCGGGGRAKARPTHRRKGQTGKCVAVSARKSGGKPPHSKLEEEAGEAAARVPPSVEPSAS
jgi:hypothetical protein